MLLSCRTLDSATCHLRGFNPTISRLFNVMPDYASTIDLPTGRPIRVLIALLFGYKKLISPLFTGSCRFVPSCSSYAIEAVAGHGAILGSWLTVRRLARCHPLCRGGLDQVPQPQRSDR